MAAFFGGEVLAHVRGTKLPAQLLDFGGAYGIAGSLIRAWDVLSAEEVVIEEIPASEAAAQLEALASEFSAYVQGGPPPSAEAWQGAWLMVHLSPKADVLPHRPRQGETWSTVRAPLTYRKGSLPWLAPDVIVHLLEGGTMPRIERALRIVPKGRASLRAITLPTDRVVDPSREDLVRVLVDERLRVRCDPSLNRVERRRLRRLLKNIVVGLLTGLTVQINDDEPTKSTRRVHVVDPRTGAEAAHAVHVMETPGDWYFPLIAAAVTATARLLLHLVIEMVHAQGGIVAYWDTDSVLVVALPEGGLAACIGGTERLPDGRAAVRALSFAEIRQIQWHIEELLPVSDDMRTYVHATGPDGEWARIPQPSRLELEAENFDGPRGFSTTLYGAVRAAKKYHLYAAEEVGPWVEIFDGKGVVIQPTPEQLARPQDIGVRKVSEHGLPQQAPDGSPLWIADGDPVLIVAGKQSLLRTLGGALARAWSSSDRRMLMSDGRVVGARTEGVLTPLHSIASRLRIIGKESRHLGIGRGTLHGAEFTHYGGDEALSDVREAARRLTKEAGIREELIETAGVSERAFAYWLSGDRNPRPERVSTLTSVIARLARERLLRADPFGTVPNMDDDGIAAFLDLPEPEYRCQYCGKPLSGRAKKWCPGDVCRKRFERTAQRRLILGHSP